MHNPISTWTLRLCRAGLGLACAWGALAPAAADTGGHWSSAGGDVKNTRHQETETKISVASVPGMRLAWAFTTQGDVSATPAVDGRHVYFPDWAGNLYAVDRQTGQPVWQVRLASLTGVPFDKARATPVIAGNKLIVGTQGSILVPGGGPGARMLALDQNTGALLWSRQLGRHPAAIITQSATVHADTVYVGVASMEEALAGFVPGYPCCSFRGSMFALDANTGAVIWETAMAPPGYSGNAIWGSSPAVDARRGQLYIATGNNYAIPQSALVCVRQAGNDAQAIQACLPADNHFDSIMALDLRSGAIRWATRALPYDTWTVSCFPFLGDGSNCPKPAGPDYDFGQAPALFSVRATANTPPRDLVGAGQKSGQYWALDPDTGRVVWVSVAGPGGTGGGLQWGSAVDRERVYTANANSNLVPWTLPNGTTVTSGVWSALDAATGALLWQTAPPLAQGGSTSGPVTTANGVVFGCSLDPLGHMYALEAATGRRLWQFSSGGSCLSGAAISNGQVFWGSGYANLGFGTPNQKLYAFEVR